MILWIIVAVSASVKRPKVVCPYKGTYDLCICAIFWENVLDIVPLFCKPSIHVCKPEFCSVGHIMSMLLSQSWITLNETDTDIYLLLMYFIFCCCWFNFRIFWFKYQLYSTYGTQFCNFEFDLLFLLLNMYFRHLKFFSRLFTHQGSDWTADSLASSVCLIELLIWKR